MLGWGKKLVFCSGYAVLTFPPPPSPCPKFVQNPSSSYWWLSLVEGSSQCVRAALPFPLKS